MVELLVMVTLLRTQEIYGFGLDLVGQMLEKLLDLRELKVFRV